jgi:prepilin-type N-terminal cleavage/methylation domain-containing protein
MVIKKRGFTIIELIISISIISIILLFSSKSYSFFLKETENKQAQNRMDKLELIVKDVTNENDAFLISDTEVKIDNKVLYKISTNSEYNLEKVIPDTDNYKYKELWFGNNNLNLSMKELKNFYILVSKKEDNKNLSSKNITLIYFPSNLNKKINNSLKNNPNAIDSIHKIFLKNLKLTNYGYELKNDTCNFWNEEDQIGFKFNTKGKCLSEIKNIKIKNFTNKRIISKKIKEVNRLLEGIVENVESWSKYMTSIKAYEVLNGTGDNIDIDYFITCQPGNDENCQNNSDERINQNKTLHPSDYSSETDKNKGFFYNDNGDVGIIRDSYTILNGKYKDIEIENAINIENINLSEAAKMLLYKSIGIKITSFGSQIFFSNNDEIIIKNKDGDIISTLTNNIPVDSTSQPPYTAIVFTLLPNILNKNSTDENETGIIFKRIFPKF